MYKKNQFAVLVNDITERKLAEEILRENEERFRAISEYSFNSICIINQVGKIVWFNEAMLKMSGFTTEQINAADSFAAFLAPESMEFVLDNFMKFVHKQEYTHNYEFYIIRADGEKRLCEKHMSHFTDRNGTLNLVISMLDITERRNNEIELKIAKEKIDESELKYRLIAENTSDGIIVLDAKSKVQYVSPSYLKQIGYSHEDEMSRNAEIIYSIIHPEDRDALFKDIYEAIEDKKEGLNYSYRVKHNDGHYIWREDNAKFNYDSDFNYINSYVICRDITERKKSEQELIVAKEKAEKNEKRLIQAQSTAKIGSWETDLKNFNVVWSEETYKIFELDASSFIASHAAFIEFVHPDDRIKVNEAFNKSFNNVGYNSVQHRIVTSKKNIKFVEERWKIIKDENANPIIGIGTCQDITEHILFENQSILAKKLAENNEEKFKKYFNYSPDGVFIADENGFYKEVNPSASSITGYSIEELCKMNLMDLIPETSIQTAKEHFSLLVATGFSEGVSAFIRKDKSIGYWIVSAVKLSKTEFLGFTKDITELKEQELELLKAKEIAEENEVKFKAAFFTSPDSVNINKLNGEYVEINEGFTRLTGFIREDVIGKLSSEIDIWSIPEDREKLISSLKEFGLVENLESIFRKNNGDLIPALMSARIINIKNEPHILSVTREIAERKKFEQELIVAKEKAEESDRLKSAFLANMSHEIRTPMNGILGFADLLKEPNLSGEDQKMYIEIIEKSGIRMLNIINDIVSISRVEAGTMSIYISETNINELMDYIFNFFKPEAEKKGLQLICNNTLINENISVNTDSEKIYAVLTNLVKNSLKFTQKGSIEFGCIEKETTIEFYVKDTGAGVCDKHKEFIFERFRQGDDSLTRNHEGAGLGLSISKAYIEMLGGKIWVESEEGKGSTFYFTIKK
ncbi:MAG: PAS domain S-box protein [Bacteroidota bacterium]